MYLTTPVRKVTAAICFSLIVIGAFEDLDKLAALIASNVTPGHLHVVLTEYPTGWRLQITHSNRYPDDAHDLVQQRINEGLAVQIANGKQPMATRVYTASVTHAEPFCSNERCPCHTDIKRIYEHAVKPFMAGELTGREGVAFTYGRFVSPPQPQDNAGSSADYRLY